MNQILEVEKTRLNGRIIDTAVMELKGKRFALTSVIHGSAVVSVTESDIHSAAAQHRAALAQVRTGQL